MYSKMIVKRRKTLFSFFGLLLIVSMLVTSTMEVQALNDGEVTESLVVASSSSTETGDGDKTKPSSSPTEVTQPAAPSASPTQENKSSGSTTADPPTNTPDDTTEPETQETGGSTTAPPTQDTPTPPTPSETASETVSDTSTVIPSDTQTETEVSPVIPSVSPTETASETASETSTETSTETPTETQTETETSTVSTSETPTETTSETPSETSTETPTETPAPPKNDPTEEEVTVTEEEPVAPDLSIEIVTNSIEDCDSVSFGVSLINAGGPITSDVSVKVTSDVAIDLTPSTLTFSQAGSLQTVSVNNPWNMDFNAFTLTASIIGDEGDPGVGVTAKATVEKPESCQQQPEPPATKPILDISVKAGEYDFDTDSVSFEVSVINTGSAEANNVVVNITTSPEMEAGLVQPTSLTFGNVGFEEGSNSQSQTITVASPWASENTSLTLTATISGNESDPGFGKSAEAIANMPQENELVNVSIERNSIQGQEERGIGIFIDVSCSMDRGKLEHKWTVFNYGLSKLRFKWSSTTGEKNDSWTEVNPYNLSTFYTNATAQTVTVEYQWRGFGRWKSSEYETKSPESCGDFDLDLDITDVTTTCFNVDVTVKVSNPNQYADVSSVEVSLGVANNEFVSDSMPVSHTFSSIPKSGSREHTFSIQTNEDWIKASSSDSIVFTASILSAGQPDPNPANNSDTGQAVNPGNCLPDLSISIQVITPNNERCGDIAYKVTVSNSGKTEAKNVEITNTIAGGSEYTSGLTPAVWSFGVIGADSFKDKQITIQTNTDWLYAHTGVITARVEITNETVNPGVNVGKSKTVDINNPGNCDHIDLSLSIIDVDSDCLGVDVTVRVRNPNKYIDAVNVVVNLGITHGGGYVSSATPLTHTFPSISKDSSSSHVFTIQTNNNWINATILDTIGFAATATIDPSQTDPNPGNNSDSDQARNPGLCKPNLVIWIELDMADYCGDIPFTVKIKNLGKTSAKNVTVDLSYTAADDYVDSINPSTLNFGDIPGFSTAERSATLITSSLWLESLGRLIVLQADITNEDINPDNIGRDDAEHILNNCAYRPEVTTTCEVHEGTLKHKWILYNPNHFSIDVKLSGQSSFTDLDGHASTTFYTDHTNQTVTVYYKKHSFTNPHQFNVTVGNCLTAPTLNVECNYFGGGYSHVWTLENPNAVPINYSWTGNSTPASGNGTVGAGGTAYITTDLEAQTMSLSYTYDGVSYTLPTKSAETCLVDLELTYECQSDGQHKWKVKNQNIQTSVDVTWWTDPDHGSSSISSLNSDGAAYFYTDSSAHTTYVSYTYAGETHTTSLSAEVCLIPLELDYECHDYNGSHIWTVTNANGFAIDFTWATEDGLQSGGPITVTAGPGTTATFTTDGTAHKVIVSYLYDGDAKSVEYLADACKSSDLVLSFLCGFSSDVDLYWKVANPYGADITVDWEVKGEAENGSFILPANSESTFTTSIGPKTVALFVDGIQVSEADSGDACCEELMLTYTCLDNGQQQWTVTNNNSFDQSFTWSSSAGQSGTGNVLANSTTTFITNNKDHTVKIEYKHEPFPTKSTSVIAEVCKISEDIPDVPTTTTTTTTTTTSTTATTSTSASMPPGETTETGMEWIIFTTLRDGNLEVYRLDGIEGVGNFKLYNLSKSDWIDTRPNRSFDDQWVTYQSNRDGNLEIYVTDNVGSEQIRLTDNPANDKNPVFSPDNTNIVFQSDRNGSWDLYMVNRLTGEEVQLTDHSADEINPSFSSSNANLVVYESNKNGNQDIFLLNIVTGEEFQITNGEGDEIRPILSPNAQKIAYLSSVDSVLNLFVIGIDGENPLQITNGDGDTMNPTWSPDSTRLAYQSKRNGNIDIYTYDLRDGTEYRLTDNAGQDTAPSWDKTGTNVYYTAKIDKIALDIYRVFWKGGNSIYITNNPSSDMWSK